MDNHSWDKAKRMLCKETEEITQKGELSAGDLQALHMLTDTIKNIDKIQALEGEHDGEYARAAGTWEARGGYGRDMGMPMSYDGGSSYTSRGTHYVRGHYSRAEAQDELVSKMRAMLEDTSIPPHYRETIRAAMRELD